MGLVPGHVLERAVWVMHWGTGQVIKRHLFGFRVDNSSYRRYFVVLESVTWECPKNSSLEKQRGPGQVIKRPFLDVGRVIVLIFEPI
mgnify:FL=1